MSTLLRTWRRVIAAGLAAAVLVSISAPVQVWAHHGWSGYGTDDFTLDGTVQMAMLGNPHGLIKVRDGQGRVWDVVLGPPGNQRRAGLTEALLPTGAEVRALGRRHLDPARLEMKTERLVIGDRSFDIYPDRL